MLVIKYIIMKSMLLKTCVLLPFVAVGSYFFLALFGCIAAAAGAGDAFYCGFYCKFSIGFLIAAGGALVTWQAVKHYKNCQEG